MMKCTISLVFILICLSPVLAQDNTVRKDSAFKKINDTTFIIREFQQDIYHAVYLEKDSKSKCFKWLTDFSMDKEDKAGLREQIKTLKPEESVKPLKKHNMQGLPKNWLPLYQYSKKFYLYAPSDWGNAGRRIISDSVFINWYMDGPNPNLILSVKKTDAQTFVIKYKEYASQELPETLTIHIIDPKIKLAVWEYSGNNSVGTYYALYIPAAAAANYDVIVNYCRDMKQREFEFDTIDFKKLLKWK